MDPIRQAAASARPAYDLDACARFRHSRFHSETIWGKRVKNLLLQLFTWWNGATVGTRLFTARHGQFVGEDEAGNRYYQTAGGKRRWVVYNGYAEGSAVPPGWYGWLHHTVDFPPVNDGYAARAWQKPHEPNATGTVNAWRPSGSLLNPDPKPQGEPTYTAWTPQ